jgi:hypothetical protein
VTLAVAVLLVVASAGAIPAGQPSTTKDRATAVRLTRQLEADPLGVDASQARYWLVTWLQQAQDVTITVHDLLGTIPSTDRSFQMEIEDQQYFSYAAFVIEHPERATDDVAVGTAGVEGALKAYSVILRVHPDARLDSLDELIRQRDAGVLVEYVRTALEKQKKASTPAAEPSWKWIKR